MPCFEQLLAKIRKESKTKQELGRRFEIITKEFLTTDRLYKKRFAKVYLWEEWPYRPDNTLTGVDLMAEEHNGELCAIQCKCYEDNTPIDDGAISKFLSELATLTKDGRAVNTLLAYTTNRVTAAAERKLRAHHCHLLSRAKFDNGTVDWCRYPELWVRAPKNLMGRQEQIYASVLDELERNHSGRLVMNRNDGRDLVTLRIAEKLAESKGVVLYISPSAKQMQQTVKSWGENHLTYQHYYTLLDERLAAEDGSITELTFPPTTIDGKLHARYTAAPGVSMRVIFCTCSTVLNVPAAIKEEAFDLMIYDEIGTNKSKQKKDDDCLSVVTAGNVINATKKLYLESPEGGYKETPGTGGGRQADYSYAESVLREKSNQYGHASEQQHAETDRERHTQRRYERGLDARQNDIVPVSTAVWIAAATLHKAYGKTEVFRPSAIMRKVKEQKRYSASDETIQQHVTHHCVANANASPATHRMLYRVRTGRYRLYCRGDNPHPTRVSGKIRPLLREMPDEYKDLIRWYDEEYCSGEKSTSPPSPDHDMDSANDAAPANRPAGQGMRVTAATAVWITTAMLHMQHGVQRSFHRKVIIEGTIREGLADVTPTTIDWHTNLQCVANLAANPSKHRMLYRTDNREYRLYREGDPYDPTRKRGKITPLLEDIPPKYQYLLEWYHDVYCR